MRYATVCMGLGEGGDAGLVAALDRLTKEVNKWLADGWRPLGGPAAALTAGGGSGFVLQAITKEAAD